VCDDDWGGHDAAVVCQQLNFTGNGGDAIALSSAYFGSGTGFIILDNVNCDGNESSLLSCDAQELGQHNCFSIEDAGVICPGKYCMLWSHDNAEKQGLRNGRHLLMVSGRHLL
jgi:hypothetical protein